MQIASLTELRQQLITPITGHVVEIGFGTGLNLPFYGAGVLSLTTVDPNAGVAKLAEQRTVSYTHLTLPTKRIV